VRIVIGYRALIALAASLVITFTRPDKALLALIVFAGFALLNGVGSMLIGFVKDKNNALQNVVVQGVLSLLAGAAALLEIDATPTSQLVTLQLLVVGYLVLNSAYEIYLGSRAGFKSIEGREHLIAAGLGLLIALIYVVLNPEPLNAAGFLGAYFALSAVHQGIWAASPAKAD
jgi:uncharacterized membrane protein HdeD (DUF308 family)